MLGAPRFTNATESDADMTSSRTFARAGLALLVLACNDTTGNGTQDDGSLLVNVATTGHTFDADGYTIQLDGEAVQPVSSQESVEIANLSPGEHALGLTGLASNCRVAPPQMQTVVVTSAQQVTATLAVRCDSLLQNVIVFSRIHDGTSTIYWISPGGSAPVLITEGFHPSVSPDGSQIAFVRVDPQLSVWRMNVDGTGLIRLTSPDALSQSPAWSPDGQRIAFVTHRDGNFEIYSMRPDGLEQVRLTQDPADDQGPVWSPDGARLAFTRDVEGGSTEVFLMNANGTGQVNVTQNPAGDVAEAWSPDGSHLLINSTREPELSNELYRIDVDGSNAINLSNSPTFEAAAAWSPAGDAIAFASDREEGLGLALYRADAEGHGVVRLTNPTVDQVDVSVQWIP